MTEPKSPSQDRAERLAEQLRANLKRRKAQARALAQSGADHENSALPKSGPVG